MKFVIQSKSGTRLAEITSTPCNGDSSFVSYRLMVDGQSMGGGICKPSEFSKIVRKWAGRMLVGVTSVKMS